MSLLHSERARSATVVAVLATAAFVVLTILVGKGTTQQLDVAARDFFRPNGVWGPAQMWATPVVEGLKPPCAVAILALTGVAASVRRRSWRPALIATSIGVTAGAAALFTKVLLERPDPSYEMQGIGGAFPSGHMVSVLVCFGGALLVLRARPRPWEWAAVAALGLAMALALLLQTVHWFTDVVGGALLGTAILAAAVVFVSRPREDTSGRGGPENVRCRSSPSGRPWACESPTAPRPAPE